MATKSPVRTDKAPAPLQGAPYSQAIRYDDLVFVSGQLPLSPAGEVVGTTIEEQTDQVLKNIRAILEAAGTRMDKLVKTTVFLASHERLRGDERASTRSTSAWCHRRARWWPSRTSRAASVLEIDAIAHV